MFHLKQLIYIMEKKEMDNMYFYSVGYGSYEDSGYIQFTHSSKFSDEQLERVVEDCLFEVLKKFGTEDSNFSELMFHGDRERYFMTAMKKRGFVPLKYTARFSVFGWANSIDPEDWEETLRGDNVTRRLQKNLKKRMEENEC